MGSINKSHNEADGGILLFQGELILLYCDSVSCEIGGKESIKGRVYLTTHRLVVIVTPYRPNSAVKSLCAPFCAITRCSVEQPIFGANYIEATVRDEADSSKSFSFKLKFSKGGAIELAMAMNRAVAAVGRNYNPSMPPPPAYTPSPSAQYYQAPPTVYAPGYNCGVQMPVQQFPDQPPIGFIYASSAPPPYPGLGGNSQPGAQSQPYGGQQPSYGGQQQPPYQEQGGGYPSSSNPAANYPTNQGGYSQPPSNNPAGYPPAQTSGGYPQATYPGQQPAATYPGQQPAAAYPGQQPAAAAYPGQQPPATYPGQQPPAAYPGQQPPAGNYPNQPAQQQPSSAGYPDLSGNQSQPGGGSTQTDNNSAPSWPSAPSYNPNWQDGKKS